MGGFVVTGYDVLMVIWGVVFIVGAVGFLFAMNRLFQSEERHQEQALEPGLTEDHSGPHHFRPAA
jgi:hypothetical protein